MNWRTWTWKDYAGLSLVGVLVAGLLVAYVWLPGFFSLNLSGTKASLGPDWTCTYPGKGDPVCLKKPPSN
jgi:hypothetical protein